LKRDNGTLRNKKRECLYNMKFQREQTIFLHFIHLCIRRRFFSSVYLISLMYSSQLFSGSIQTIEVFATTSDRVHFSQQELNQHQVRFHYFILDAPMLLEKVLSHQLPNNAKHSVEILKRRLQDGKLGRQMMHGYQGILKAQNYQLKHTPAIVFNQTQVVYGIRQVHQAILLYQKRIKLNE